jgi:CubicO group peptidase (beta-lactamase class C family)
MLRMRCSPGMTAVFGWLYPPLMTFPLDGVCDAKFAPLREAFAGNFACRGEPGGAVALIVDGRVVADLWGGFKDAARTQP